MGKYLVTVDDQVKAYIKRIMAQLNKWMTGGKISKLVIVITSKETGENVERWQFDVCFFYLLSCLPPLLLLIIFYFCFTFVVDLPCERVLILFAMNEKVNERRREERKNIRRTPKAKNKITTKRSKSSTNHPLPPPSRNPSRHLLLPQPPPPDPKPTRTLPQPLLHSNSKKNRKSKSKKKFNQYSDKSPPR